VYIRINAYGLTPERFGLIMGGIWAIALTVIFLIPKLRDIRIIPVLAGIIFLIFSAGPWNFIYGSIVNQTSRLDTLISQAIQNIESKDKVFIWSEENAKKAIGSLKYLERENDDYTVLIRLYAKYGIEIDAELSNLDELRGLLKLEKYVSDPSKNKWRSLLLVFNPSINVSDTPHYLGDFEIYETTEHNNAGSNLKAGLTFSLSSNSLVVKKVEDLVTGELVGEKVNIDLNEWIEKQNDERITQPEIDFEIDGVDYRLVVHLFQLFSKENKWQVQSFDATLFSSEPIKASP
jgi:hypothetical protein